MKFMNQPLPIAIIGAGITGLHLAQTLQRCGFKSVLFEKSKGIGGRIATRRIDDLGFDHGAADLDPSVLFQSYLGNYGITLPVQGGMNQIAKKMAQGLEILKESKVIRIIRKDQVYHLETENGPTYHAHHVVVTAPLPQALELLKNSGIQEATTSKLESIQYEKALILLAITKTVATPFIDSSSSHRMISMKNRNLHPRGWVVQFSSGFSEAHFEKSDDEISNAMQSELQGSFLDFEKIEKKEIKKWRYSVPQNTRSEKFWIVQDSLILAGDAFGNPMISADATAEWIRKHAEDAYGSATY